MFNLGFLGKRPSTISKLFYSFCVAFLIGLVYFPAFYTLKGGYDFSLRYNECRLIIEERQDPVDVVAQRVESIGYRYFMDDREENKHKKIIHAYPPWEYAILLPIAHLSKINAYFVYKIINFIAFLGIITWCIWLIRRLCPNLYFCHILVPLLVVPFYIPINSCLALGNYGLLITAAYAGIIWALATKRPIAITCFWVIAMLKPQLGVWLFIPLLLNRQWKALILAPLICCLLSCIPAFYLGKSPVEMILQLADTSSQSSGITHYGRGLFAFLHYTSFASLIVPLNMLMCLILGFFMSWRLRTVTEKMLTILPFTIFVLWGSYSQPHDRELLILPLLTAIIFFLRYQGHLKIQLFSFLLSCGIGLMCTFELYFFGCIFSPWQVEATLSKVFVCVDPLLWIIITILYCVVLQQVNATFSEDK